MDEETMNPAEPSIAEQFGVKHQKKKATARKKVQKPLPTNDDVVKEAAMNATTFAEKSSASGIRVCEFDELVDNHFRAVDRIIKICGEKEEEESGFFKDEYIECLSSRISFLRDWRKFIHEPRVVRFANERGDTRGKDDCSEINLSWFSSATVPKEVHSEGNEYLTSRDFIMHVGGFVWGLDWSPSHYGNSNCRTTCEFVAVASHPPGSAYHKLGAPQSGPGIVQIWGFPSMVMGKEESISKNPPKRDQQPLKRCQTNKKPTNEAKKPRGRPRKYPSEDSINKPVKPKVRPRKKLKDGSPDTLALKDTIDTPKRPRGRPRKKLIDGSAGNFDSNSQLSPALAIQFSNDSSELRGIEGIPGSSEEHAIHGECPKKPKKSAQPGTLSAPTPRISCRKRKLRNESMSEIYEYENPLPLLSGEENRELSTATDSLPFVTGEETTVTVTASDSPMLVTGGENTQTVIEPDKLPIHAREESRLPVLANNQTIVSPQQDGATSKGILDNGSSELGAAACSIPEEVALPRLMLCIAHNGKVAWDVKWKPLNLQDSISKHRMGYLAVLLGDGSLKVWDVPLPHTIKTIYLLSAKEDNDPRFVNLEPVFTCTTVKCFDRQSIPLTVEWSAPPHDYLLAGFHDGTIALWKFSPNSSSSTNDTRPLLCFNADSFPIRSVAFAPTNSDHECPNVVVTAGHDGLKFWDIRDPFQPLWDLRPAPRYIYGLDWLPDPGCLIISFDDGTMKLLSLVKAMCDAPVNGKDSVGTKQQGFNTYFCTKIAIWSVHISRCTGMVAYCSADGTVKHFQLHPKAAEKDFARYRTPHFVCGFLTDDESVVTVHTPLLDRPSASKKPARQVGKSHSSAKNMISGSNSGKQANADAETQTPNNRTLAICYNNETTVDPRPEKTLKSQDASKSSSSSKKNPEHDQAHVCIDEVQEKDDGGKGTAVTTESFPAKIVAIHRVRWNMNKGSERWLCYGGAAGIVRCQEIFKG